MIQASRCDALGLVLGQEQELTGHLAAALQEEHDAMLARSPERLEQVIGVKQHILEQFEHTQQQRHELLRDTGLTSDKAGFETLIEQCAAADRDYRAQWAELKAGLQACQQQNEINGKIIVHIRDTPPARR